MRRNVIDQAAFVEWLEFQLTGFVLLASAQRSLPEALNAADLAESVSAKRSNFCRETYLRYFSVNIFFKFIFY
jgi:hypothetical protein